MTVGLAITSATCGEYFLILLKIQMDSEEDLGIETLRRFEVLVEGTSLWDCSMVV